MPTFHRAASEAECLTQGAAAGRLGLYLYGPIYEYPDPAGDGSVPGGDFVQVYIGQHEWVAIRCDDLQENWLDPGWEGDPIGWGWIEGMETSLFNSPGHVSQEIEPPARKDGKPITSDQLLFADKAKLQEYLGPDDPLSPKEGP